MQPFHGSEFGTPGGVYQSDRGKLDSTPLCIFVGLNLLRLIIKHSGSRLMGDTFLVYLKFSGFIYFTQFEIFLRILFDF